MDSVLKNISFSNRFVLYAFDPITSELLPILHYMKKKGYEIFYTSYSLDKYYTKSFGMYNGPFTNVLSPHKGFSELFIKSSYSGKLTDIKCYQSIANLRTKKNIEKKRDSGSFISLIIPENTHNWFLEISLSEIEEFSLILYELTKNYKIKVFVKKKKLKSKIEDFLNNSFQNNRVVFTSPERGSMTDFEDKNFIISLGLSSLAIKAAELYNKPYLIYDKSDNSLNLWHNIYFKSPIEPIFVSNLEDILKTLNHKLK